MAEKKTHTAPHTERERKEAGRAGKDREIDMPNQTAADITVLCAFGFSEASLVFKRQTCVTLRASSF